MKTTEPRTVSSVRLVNGSTGDPVLYVDYPGRDDALLFDAGDLASLGADRLKDLAAVFLSHHHMDHFTDLDRIIRANLDQDKTLHIYGPEGTIRRIYDRIKSYEHPFFPFQKLVIKVHDVLVDRLRWAELSCAKRFPEPEVSERVSRGRVRVIYANDDLSIETALVDHTVPCLAFAMVEKSGVHPDAARLSSGPLRPGTWVARVLDLLRNGTSPETPVEIDGGRFALGTLADRYFTTTKGSRLAYITDTAWSEASRPALMKLAHRARWLYCDSYYAGAQLRQAETYRHMTAAQAAELAVAARVEELVLIHFAPRYKGRYPDLLAEARSIFPRTSAELGDAGTSGPANE
ncbi:MAG: MBL fold metallo-hydrolase [Isosphaeraceae bacterium]